MKYCIGLLILVALSVRAEEPPLVFGMTPVLGFEASQKRFQPLIDHLSAEIGRPVEIKVTESYRALIEEMAAGRLDLAKLSPLAYVRARRLSDKVEPLVSQVANGSTTYSSYLMALESAAVKPLENWREARLCLSDPDSASGFLMPVAYLLERGIQPYRHFALVEFAGHHKACLEGLFSGKYDIAATFAGALHDARQAGLGVGDLVFVAKAGRVPYDAWCVRADLDPGLKEKLRRFFLSTNTLTSQGRRVLEPTLGINGWVETNDQFYDELRRIEERVEKELQR
jgi:phosphonate transport system substrate-binding protein